jgi:hypothetical protein
VLHAVPNQQTQVGTELTIELIVLNAGGNAPRFSVRSPTIPDLLDRPTPPQFVPFGAGGAYLRWTPVARDVGEHVFRVDATSGDGSSGVNFRVRVVAGSAAPVFLKPLGSGKTVNLGDSNCVDFEIAVQDTDTPRVSLFLEPPIEDGYTFEDSGNNTGTFEWCPSANQVRRASRYSVNFAADDGDGHITRKPFSLLLREALGVDCPGRAPDIEHQPPANTLGLSQIELTVRIADDIGVGIPEPTVYYTVQEPANLAERDITDMSVINMKRRSGTERDGLYVATVPLQGPAELLNSPNPRLYYFIEATDNDDPGGNCDHRSSAPSSGYYSVEISPPSQAAPVTPCEVCAADSVCGSGLCVDLGDGQPVCLPKCGVANANPSSCDRVSSAGCCDGQYLVVCSAGQTQRIDCGAPSACGWNASEAAYSCRSTGDVDPDGQFPRACGQGAVPSGGSECPADFTCSNSALTSVDLVTELLCIPNRGSCIEDCQDDNYEENDTQEQVRGPEPLGARIDDLKLCGDGTRVDEDFYGVFLEVPTTLIVQSIFSHTEGDIDISLLDNLGQVLGAGYSTTDDERIERCVEAGFYYIHAWSFNRRINNEYALTIEASDQACCSDDAFEDDDGPGSAHLVASGDTLDLRSICPDDEDWYAINLNAGETINVDVLFDHQAPEDDLDVFVYAPDGVTNLTPCCSPVNGQSSNDDEQLSYQAQQSGRFYVVVRGYRGSNNDYLVGFEVDAVGMGGR